MHTQFVKKTVLTTLMCTFFVYGSENDPVLTSRYATAMIEVQSLVDQVGISPHEAAKMVAENYAGVASERLLNLYNARYLRAPVSVSVPAAAPPPQTSAAVAAPRAAALPKPSLELLHLKDYPEFKGQLINRTNVVTVFDAIKLLVDSGANLETEIYKIDLERIYPLNRFEFKNLYHDIIAHSPAERFKIAISHIIHCLLKKKQAAHASVPAAYPQASASASEPLVATAPPALDYVWENDPSLRGVRGAPEATVTIEGARFNIYNVTSFGHCGLYTINTTRDEVLEKARQTNNRTAAINQLAQHPGAPLSILELSEIGQLLNKNIVFFVQQGGHIGKVREEFDENTGEIKELPPINEAWETYYVYNTGGGHFKIAAPEGDVLLNRYGKWKQSVVKTDRDFPEGYIDYAALDRSQTLQE